MPQQTKNPKNVKNIQYKITNVPNLHKKLRLSTRIKKCSRLKNKSFNIIIYNQLIRQ